MYAPTHRSGHDSSGVWVLAARSTTWEPTTHGKAWRGVSACPALVVWWPYTVECTGPSVLNPPPPPPPALCPQLEVTADSNETVSGTIDTGILTSNVDTGLQFPMPSSSSSSSPGASAATSGTFTSSTGAVASAG